MRNPVVCAIALLAIASPLFPQNIRTATLIGTVIDSSGAVVANVAVTLTNQETQVVTRSLSNSEGAYYLPFVIAGNYRLVLESPGFKRYERSGLALNAGETPRI